MRRRMEHKQKIVKPDSTICPCGVDAKDGYDVPEFHPVKAYRPKVIRMCVECYERSVRNENARYKGSLQSSATKGYHV
jgi:hypothetical protein